MRSSRTLLSRGGALQEVSIEIDVYSSLHLQLLILFCRYPGSQGRSNPDILSKFLELKILHCLLFLSDFQLAIFAFKSLAHLVILF